MRKRRGGGKAREILQHIEHLFLHSLGGEGSDLGYDLFACLASVKAVVGLPVIEHKLKKSYDPGHHEFTALRQKEFLKSVVSERRILDIDLADNADLCSLHIKSLDASEILRHIAKVTSHCITEKPAIM